MLNYNNLILTSIDEKIEKIQFTGTAKKIENLKTYSKILCSEVFNLYIRTYGHSDFTKEIPLPLSYIKTIIPKPETRSTILRELNNNNILISDGKYIFTNVHTTKKIGGDGKEIEQIPQPKKYKFDSTLIYNTTVSFSEFRNFSSTDEKILYKKMKPNFDMLTISDDAFKFIPEMVEEKLSTILVDDEILDLKATLIINDNKVTATTEYWLKQAKTYRKSLIKFNDKFYIDNIKEFIDRKRTDLIILHEYNVRKIQNKEWYCQRNKTNQRLDSNFTCLSNKLFEFVYLKGEKTVEIDLVNSQFAFLSNIKDFPMDEIFIVSAQNGNLYELIMEKLNLSGKDGRLKAKKYMMLATFGKERNHPRELIEVFPILMKSITEFKQLNGYTAFSIMLQNTESAMMITNVLAKICAKRIPCLSIHDSIRVREQDYDRTLEIMQNIFDEADFKCRISEK